MANKEPTPEEILAYMEEHECTKHVALNYLMGDSDLDLEGDGDY